MILNHTFVNETDRKEGNEASGGGGAPFAPSAGLAPRGGHGGGVPERSVREGSAWAA